MSYRLTCCANSQQWLRDPQDLSRDRHQDLILLAEDDYQKVMIFFANRKSLVTGIDADRRIWQLCKLWVSS